MPNRARGRYDDDDDGVEAFMSLMKAQEKRGQVFLHNGRLTFAAPAAAVKQLAAKRKRKAEPLSELDIMCGYDDEDSDDVGAGDQDVSDDYSPGDDSEDEAPKKKKPSSTASKKAAGHSSKGSSGVQQQQQPSEKVAKAAATALRSVKSNISAQMQYKKKSLKYGTARCAMEAPCLPLEVVEAMLGPGLLAKASNGRKQLKVEVDEDALREMFPGGGWGGPFSKSLRYGATLGLIKGLTFTYNKEDQVLKVTGSYTMNK